MENRDKAGLAVLIAKLGPKIAVVVLKLKTALLVAVKELFGMKSAGIIASAGLYAYLFTWQMGLGLVALIGVHEYGHMWAMQRRGIPTRGIYFIPGFGAVTIAETTYGSARKQAFISIMGPAFGMFGFVIPMVVAFAYTRNPLFAAVASFTAFVNFINLLPINPLDGGRIMKSIAYSDKYARSLAFTVGISLVTAVLGIFSGFGLLVYMAVVGFFESAGEFGIREKISTFLRLFVRMAIASVPFIMVGIARSHACHDSACTSVPPWTWPDRVGEVLLGTSFVVLFLTDIRRSSKRFGTSWFAYPSNVLRETWMGFREVARLRKTDVTPIVNFEKMSGSGKALYITCFVGLALLHIIVIALLAHIPGASIAKTFLQ